MSLVRSWILSTLIYNGTLDYDIELIFFLILLFLEMFSRHYRSVFPSIILKYQHVVQRFTD